MGKSQIPGGGEAFSAAFLQIRKTMFLLKEAESISELYERTGCFLSEIADREDLKDSHILISTHGAANDSFVEPDKRKYADKRFLEI